MTEITILHISDLHCGIKTDDPSFDENREKVLESFLDSYKTRLEGANGSIYQPDAIVVSGDIGWKGLEDDYKGFKEKNGGFLDRLAEITGVPKKNIFVCPGNHDKSVPKDYTELDFRADQPSGKKSTEFIARFDNYSKAMKECELTPYSIYNGKSFDGESYLYGFRTVEIKGKNLCFIAQNTAWLCDYRKDQTKSSDKGQLSMGPAFVSQTALKVRNLKAGGTPVDAVITLFHHPKEWLKRADTIRTHGPQLAFEILVKESDIICRGHEHENYETKYGNVTVYAAGTINSDDTIEASCNLITLSFDDETPKKTTKRRAFEATWDLDGIGVVWKFSDSGAEEVINPLEFGLYCQEKWKEEKTRNSALEAVNIEQKAAIEAMKEEKKKGINNTSQREALYQRTSRFLDDADMLSSKELSVEELLQAEKALKEAYAEDIKRIAENDLDTLLECNKNLDILGIRPGCTEHAIVMCIAAFKGAMETLNKQNKEIDSPMRKLTLDSDDKAGGRDKK